MDNRTAASPAPSVDSDEDYRALERSIGARVTAHRAPVFATSAEPAALWGHYLMGIRDDLRQHYNCHACRRFVERYGGLAYVDSDGTLRPLMWDPAATPEFFKAAVTMLHDLVARSRIIGVFLTDGRCWGDPITPNKKGDRIWTHLHGRISSDAPFVARSSLLNASQVMAEKAEDHRMVVEAIRDYPATVTQEVLRVLRSGALDRSEKTVGIAEWFASLHGHPENRVWLAVATAPPGYCHVRSTMIGTILDDVKSGLDFESVRRRWAEKINPIQYQRPQAPPSSGQVDAAERLVDKLGLARSLERRYATLDDVHVKIWTPKDAEPRRGGGVFGHLLEQAPRSLVLPPQRVTWERFRREALAAARSIEVRLPRSGAFYGLVTAVHADAPPILQWDDDARRNPVSWYFYNNGSAPSDWGLSGEWGNVSAVFESPPHWHAPEKFRHQKRMVCFAIKGAEDRRNDSLCLFPETLKSELHGIRSVVEAHSKSAKIHGRGSANGLAFSDGGSGSREVVLRIDENATYVVDRWD